MILEVGLIETWDVLKYDSDNVIDNCLEFNRNMGCIEIIFEICVSTG